MVKIKYLPVCNVINRQNLSAIIIDFHKFVILLPVDNLWRILMRGLSAASPAAAGEHCLRSTFTTDTRLFMIIWAHIAAFFNGLYMSLYLHI